MAWEENPRICLHMQLIAILSRTGVVFLLTVEILTIGLLTVLAVASHLCEVYLSG